MKAALLDALEARYEAQISESDATPFLLSPPDLDFPSFLVQAAEAITFSF